LGGATELTLTHSLLDDEAARLSHENGWAGSLDKLERYFPQLSTGDIDEHA
jgi:hypothetical protein